MTDTLIINAHPNPHSSMSTTNRMLAHLLAKLPADMPLCRCRELGEAAAD